MAVQAQIATIQTLRRRPGWLSALADSRNLLGILFMAPAAGLLLVFLTYPLGLGLWLGLTDTTIGRSGVFIGLGNYISLVQDPMFWLSVTNTISVCGWRSC
jgi:multiple sugar transport system permease protein